MFILHLQFTYIHADMYIPNTPSTLFTHICPWKLYKVGPYRL